jgi:acetyltransferase-like isoleucine patch superfamily enzyme
VPNFLRNIYNKLALRLYSVGKHEYEKQQELWMIKRGAIAEKTKLYLGAEIHNFSNDIKNITIGSNCHISGMLMVYSYGGFIKIGNDCSLSPNSRIISTKRIEIGNRVLIAHNVNIIDNISHPIDAALRHEDFINSYTVGMKEYDLKAAPITIGDDVWIGYNTSILKGVTIGTGAIIGSGSTVTKDVKPWTVNVGNPLRCIRELEPVQVK